MKAKPKKPAEVQLNGEVALLCCPNCGARVSTSAVVNEFLAPQGWIFYGRAGERWIKCQGESGAIPFVHFITLVNGRQDNRLAWIKPEPAPIGVQEALL
jgi:hypothetical protein